MRGVGQLAWALLLVLGSHAAEDLWSQGVTYTTTSTNNEVFVSSSSGGIGVFASTGTSTSTSSGSSSDNSAVYDGLNSGDLTELAGGSSSSSSSKTGSGGSESAADASGTGSSSGGGDVGGDSGSSAVSASTVGEGDLSFEALGQEGLQAWGQAHFPYGLEEEQPPKDRELEDTVSISSVPLDSPIYPVCKKLNKYQRYIRVSDTFALQAAINASQPGDLIEMTAGIYDRPVGFNLTVYQRNGVPGNPIRICGPRQAIITGAGNRALRPYVLHVLESSYVHLWGFTLYDGFKGLVFDKSKNCLARRLKINETGYEGLRLRYNSTFNTVRDCTITNTGRENPGTGEGIYVGSSLKNDRYDRSNWNKILNNRIGPGVMAELIDVKEYTRGGIIAYNIFNGVDIANKNFANSWVDVKGTGWVVHSNVGFLTSVDGFQTHTMDAPGSGRRNVFSGNQCYMGDAQGYCVMIQCKGGAHLCKNTVTCDQSTNQEECVPTGPPTGNLGGTQP